MLDLSLLTNGDTSTSGSGGQTSASSSSAGGENAGGNPAMPTAAVTSGTGGTVDPCPDGAACSFCDDTCTTEVCEPKALVSDSSGNSYATPTLWIQEGTLYWLDYYDQKVMRMLPSGEVETVVSNPDLNSTVTILVHKDKLYWSDLSFGIKTCPVDDCKKELQKVLVDNTNNQAEAMQLVADDSHLYWFTGPDHYARPVRRVALRTSNAKPEEVAANQDLVHGISLSDTHVYWSTRPNNQGGLVRRTSKATPGQEVDYSKQVNMAWDVAVDDTHLYIAGGSESNGSVKRCALDDPTCGPLENLLTGFGALKRARSLTVTDDYVYVANENSGTVMMSAKDGSGEPSILASDLVRPHSMISTKHCVYWRDDSNDGTIWTRRHAPPED